MIVKKMEKNGGNLKRLFTTHHSSSSLGPNNTVISGLSRKNKVKRLVEGKMLSNVDDELKNKNLMLPEKGFCDSIPRKLRSAISKRSCKSASVPVDSKRSNHSLNHCSKKSKTSMNGCSVQISKEEEEVAETLFALAGMIPLSNASLEGKPPGLARSNHADHMSSSEDPVIQNKDQGTACDQSDSSERNTVHTKPLIETSPLSWPKLPERRNVNQDLKVSAPEGHLQGTQALPRISDEKQLSENVSFPLWQSQHFVDPQAINLVLNQGRDPFRGFGLEGLPIKSSANIFPSWFNATASSSALNACGNSVLVDKVLSSGNGTRKSRKRCITHVYISHLIQGMPMSEGKDDLPLDASQLQPSQAPSIASHMYGSTMYKNVCGIGERLPMNLEHHANKDHGSKKQSVEFLSLSTGVCPKENSGANCLEAKGQVPHLPSVSQASATLPCSTAQNWFSSKAYRDQVAVASMAMPPQVQMQMPQYFAHMSHTGTAKFTQHTQSKSQNLHQQIWTSQLPAPFSPAPFLSSQIANWQNPKQDQRISTQHIPPSQFSLDMIGGKYLHVSQQQQQQQLMGRCPRFPLSTAKPQTGQLQPDGVLPFQLLCNERL